MPKRTDIKKIFVIGSGPIVIGQACEFDYSGTQACKALREEGYSVVLLNSNPATIMTDPESADRTYVEPITRETVEQIIAAERPDAILSTVGGQTALNVVMAVFEAGVLDKYQVECIGATPETIRKAEDRGLFKEVARDAGVEVLRSLLVHSMDEARTAGAELGFPLVLRPSFTLGGAGGAVAYNVEEFENLVKTGLEQSPAGSVLLEESVIGWKEFELEVMRDRMDNVVIVCSIENFDPMGVHTGDSITVAPVQTLTDREYQAMRDAAIRIIRATGVESGGCNIQFAVNPADGRMVAIEINPRVSRSSALASKATGFPIAKIAAKVAVGLTLDEIPNDITRQTPACFEPTIDYCVVKVPRFTFEKFPAADPTLTTSMKSVGEVMAIGRTFKEALQKGLRSLETGRFGLGADGKDPQQLPDADEIRKRLSVPGAERIFYIRYAFQSGMSIEDVASLTAIDPWFLDNIRQIVEQEDALRGRSLSGKSALSDDELRRAKAFGFSDRQLAWLLGATETEVRQHRKSRRVRAVYKLVDTCGGEFEAYTPYYYSTYEQEDESRRDRRDKIVILGGGPNRIGQGIEFDYCCVHASFALREEGIQSIMVNCNPETVSTDYDTSDKLYFEPLTLEDVLGIVEVEKPRGVIVQFGGQTPLNLAVALRRAGVKILGTSATAIDRAENRKRFSALLKKLNLRQPPSGTAMSIEDAVRAARRLGFPVLVRPSYVLGGRAMEIVYNQAELANFVAKAVLVNPEHPVLIDKFLEDAVEIDVDAVCDGERTVVAGIMEHIEEAGIHSGDSCCALPAFALPDVIVEEVKQSTRRLASELDVCGLINIQYAVRGDVVYVLEVNPRASRTVPFVSKATGVPWAKIATKVMVGHTLAELGHTSDPVMSYTSVKAPVFPFSRFAGVDPILGPEMKSTGEVMGIDDKFGVAFAKSQLAAGINPARRGKVFLSVANRDKRGVISVARRLTSLGFSLISTHGTAAVLHKNGIDVTEVPKVQEGARPNVLDLLKNNEIAFVINTPSGRNCRPAEVSIRAAAVTRNVPLVTTLSGANALIGGIEEMSHSPLRVRALQDYHRQSLRK